MVYPRCFCFQGDLCLACPDSVVPLLGAWIWEHFHNLPYSLLKVPGVPPWTLQAQVHQTRQILLGPQKVGNRGAKQMVYTGTMQCDVIIHAKKSPNTK